MTAKAVKRIVLRAQARGDCAQADKPAAAEETPERRNRRIGAGGADLPETEPAGEALPNRTEHPAGAAEESRPAAAGPEDGVGGHIARRRGEMCAIFDLLLEALRDEDKISKAPLNQLASALRVFMKELDEDEEDEDGAGQLSQILKAVRGIA